MTSKPIVTREVLSGGMLQWMVSCNSSSIDEAALDAARFEVGIVLDERNGHCYLRLVNTDDYNCLDHAEKIEIRFCPFCGRQFEEATND
jgi:hypothetical protein